MTQPKVSLHDYLKREMEGEKPRGYPNLLQCDKLGGWTQQQAAGDYF